MSRFMKISMIGAVAVGFSTVVVSGAVQQVSSIDLTTAIAFPASNSDLINVGSPAVESVTASDGITDYPRVVDGVVGTDPTSANTSEYMMYDGTPAYSVRFNLDTVANPLGYDISSISLISGGTIYRTNQVFGISLGLVDGSIIDLGLFSKTIAVDSTPAGDAEGQPFTYASIRTVIDDSAGDLLASGVKYINFDIRSDMYSYPGNNLGTKYREFDVVGAATVPEPSTLGLLGGVALLTLKRRRWCK